MAYNIVIVTYFLSHFFYRYNTLANYLLFGDCLTIHIIIITITIISLKYLTQTYIFVTYLVVSR